MVGGQDSTCEIVFPKVRKRIWPPDWVRGSVSNPRAVVKIRHATLFIPKVMMRILSPDWVRGSVSNPRSVVKIRHATLVIPEVRMRNWS